MTLTPFSLKVNNIVTSYNVNDRVLNAVEGVSLEINEGEVLGLVGESACGKSTLAYSILRLLPANGKITKGEVTLNGRNITNLTDDEFVSIRWKELSIIFQGAMNALNPCMTIIDQISEGILAHEHITKIEVEERSIKLLEDVGISERFAKSFPHELSGGMKQRVMIAMALGCNPKFLVADEPTTALDLIAQRNILRVLKDVQQQLNLSVMLISHDLSVIAQIADRCAIMYAAKVVEMGDIVTIFKNGLHPYTKALINSFPDLRSDKKILGIPGDPPNLLSPPTGCRFFPRCPLAKSHGNPEICTREEPKLIEKQGRPVACHLVE